MNKSKAANYVHRYQRMNGDIDVIYRFLDTVEDCLKPQGKKITLGFEHSKYRQRGTISVVFYAMMTF